MKTAYYYLLLGFALLFAACSKSDVTTPSPEVGVSHLRRNVKSNNNVTINQVIAILERCSRQSKTRVEDVFSITPYTGASTDTLMYIVNNKDSGGWTIYSSDNRTPAVLAEGDTGYFSFEEGSPAVSIWMARVAEDMGRIRLLTDDALSFTEDEIRANKAFWGEEQPRIHGDPIWHDTPPGHWEETVTSHSVLYDTLNHMVAKWDQSDPYNELCPYLVRDPNTRAFAGCVAIAGAQTLLYLHDTLGVPSTMVSEGYCIGNTSGYSSGFTNPTSTVWSSMSKNYQSSSLTTLPEAIMIGHIGVLVNMHYCDPFLGAPYSWALPENLRTNLFGPYGISCSEGNYNETITKNSLLNRMPVIVTGSDLVIPWEGGIHTFVIDGFKLTQTVYTHRHYFVLDEPPGGMMYVMPEDYYTYSYSAPELTQIRINWGWASQWGLNHINDGWYSLTGGWTVQQGGETYDYNHHLNMIYGFSVSE